MGNHSQVKSLFDTVEQHRIEWLDDSSCNIVWKTEEARKKAMKTFCKDFRDVHKDVASGTDDKPPSTWYRVDKDKVADAIKKSPHANKEGKKHQKLLICIFECVRPVI